MCGKSGESLQAYNQYVAEEVRDAEKDMISDVNRGKPIERLKLRSRKKGESFTPLAFKAIKEDQENEDGTTGQAFRIGK